MGAVLDDQPRVFARNDPWGCRELTNPGDASTFQIDRHPPVGIVTSRLRYRIRSDATCQQRSKITGSELEACQCFKDFAHRRIVDDHLITWKKQPAPFTLSREDKAGCSKRGRSLQIDGGRRDKAYLHTSAQTLTNRTTVQVQLGGHRADTATTRRGLLEQC
jgi:hypothetical protein